MKNEELKVGHRIIFTLPNSAGFGVFGVVTEIGGSFVTVEADCQRLAVPWANVIGISAWPGRVDDSGFWVILHKMERYERMPTISLKPDPRFPSPLPPQLNNSTVMQILRHAKNRLRDENKDPVGQLPAARCIEIAMDEIGRLEKWVSDLQAGATINCVYCGHQYGPNQENHLVTMRDALRAHVEVCPEHPLREMGERFKMACGLIFGIHERLSDRSSLTDDWIKERAGEFLKANPPQ